MRRQNVLGLHSTLLALDSTMQTQHYTYTLNYIFALIRGLWPMGDDG